MAYFTSEAQAQITAELPEAKAWLNTRRTARPVKTTAAGKTTPAARTNKFPASCTRCHGHVAEGQGSLKLDGGKWLVFHADGTCPDNPAPKADQTAATTPAARKTRKTPNRYAGTCPACGQHVPAGQGLLTGGPGTWGVAHDGTCPTTPAADPAPVTTQAPRRTDGPANLYPGRCTECDEWVEAGEGMRVKTDSGWQAAHKGQCPADAEEEAGGRIELTADQIAQLPIGYATVVLNDGGHRTFKVRVRKPGARRNPGAVEILYLAGSDNDNDYMPLGVIKDGALVCRTHIHSEGMRAALDVLLADPKGAQAGYAMEHEACARCGRHLSVPASIERYLGPECAKKK